MEHISKIIRRDIPVLTPVKESVQDLKEHKVSFTITCYDEISPILKKHHKLFRRMAIKARIKKWLGLKWFCPKFGPWIPPIKKRNKRLHKKLFGSK